MTLRQQHTEYHDCGEGSGGDQHERRDSDQLFAQEGQEAACQEAASAHHRVPAWEETSVETLQGDRQEVHQEEELVEWAALLVRG